MQYLNFDVEIGPGAGREYPITVRSQAGESRVTMRFPLDELALKDAHKDLQIALLRSSGVRRQSLAPEAKTVQSFGQNLFDSLIAGEVRALYDVSRREAGQKGMGVRLRLMIQAPELAALPWEYLYDARLGAYICLSRNTPVVRYLEVTQPIYPLAVTPPLRMLVMIASPSDQDGLDIQRERRRLEESLGGLEQQGLLKLRWLEGQTWRDVQRAMQQGPWHIFHFIGHGGYDERRDEGVLALANDDGKTHLLTATQLGSLLADHFPLRLVVLNACEGAKGSTVDLFSSTSATLARRGLPAVLAMQYEITDTAAIEFTRTFYETVARGKPVDEATSEARKAIGLENANTLEWGTPVLYLRAPDGKVFDMPEQREGTFAPPRAPAPSASTPGLIPNQSSASFPAPPMAPQTPPPGAVFPVSQGWQPPPVEASSLTPHALSASGDMVPALPPALAEAQASRATIPPPTFSGTGLTLVTPPVPAQPPRRVSRRAVMVGVAGLVVAGVGGGVWALTPHAPTAASTSAPTAASTSAPTAASTSAPTAASTSGSFAPFTYRGHTLPVLSVAWSRDGKRLASAGFDYTAQVWDASPGGKTFTYPQSNTVVYGVAWSPDGKRIAAANDGYTTVQVLDAVTGGSVFTYRGHSSVVYGVAWSPDGQHIASVGDDGTVQVWDAVTGVQYFTYRGHSKPVWSVAWSLDGKRLASASNDNTVQVLDAVTGSHLFTYTGHSTAVVSVAWSPDGKRLASASPDHTVQVWDAVTGGNVFTYRGHIYAVRSVAWSPDGKRIASAGDDATVQVWDAGTGGNVFTYRGHSAQVWSVAWSPEGQRLASASYDHTVQVWEPQ